MKYIITEEQLRLLELNASIRRRLHLAKEYINNLNPRDVCNEWTKDEMHDYVINTLSDMVVKCITDLEDYDEVYDYLSKKYGSYLEEFFYNSLCE
jgi:hypothetical protein